MTLRSNEAGSTRDHIASLLRQRTRGRALPAAFFRDDALFAAEVDLIFRRHWLFVASEPELPEAGDYVALSIGTAPIVLLRQDDGSISAFHNTCRHRGSLILQKPKGVIGAQIVCPYHRWAYDTSGRVVSCGTSGNELGAGLHLEPVHVRTLAGLVFVCLAEEPPADFGDMAAAMSPYLVPHDLVHTKIAKQVDLIEHGNWKLTIENNRECFHCAGHPELLRSLFHFTGDVTESSLKPEEHAIHTRYKGARDAHIARCNELGVPWERIDRLSDRTTAFVAERLPLDGHGESLTMDSRAASRRLLGTLREPKLGSLHLHTQPNSWHHFLSDHAITFSALPLDRERTLVRTTWLVHQDATEGEDYDLENLTRVWAATNAQDAAFVEGTQRGVLSPAYAPGPLAETEFMVELFHGWYEQRLVAGLDL